MFTWDSSVFSLILLAFPWPSLGLPGTHSRWEGLPEIRIFHKAFTRNFKADPLWDLFQEVPLIRPLLRLLREGSLKALKRQLKFLHAPYQALKVLLRAFYNAIKGPLRAS